MSGPNERRRAALPESLPDQPAGPAPACSPPPEAASAPGPGPLAASGTNSNNQAVGLERSGAVWSGSPVCLQSASSGLTVADERPGTAAEELSTAHTVRDKCKKNGSRGKRERSKSPPQCLREASVDQSPISSEVE